MLIIDALKTKARALKRNLTALFYVSKSPEIGWLPRVIIFVTLGYALSPVDLVPDFIPVLGYLDDLIIVPALIMLSLSLIPSEVWDAARRKAESDPPCLRKNWGFGILFILIWVGLIFSLVLSFFR